MCRMALLCGSTLLLFFAFSFVHGQSTVGTDSSTTSANLATTQATDPGTTAAPSTSAATVTTGTMASTKTTKATKSTKKYRDYYQSDYDSGYSGYYQVTGDDGKDPKKYGTDVGDFGPVYSDKRSMFSSLNLWIYAEEDPDNSNRQGTSYNSNNNNNYNNNNNNNYNNNNNNNYNNNNDDDDDGSKDYSSQRYSNQGYRKKRSYKKVRFPVKQIKKINKFPRNRFPSLISILPWVPIFYDKLTYQTIIFSPTGGIYIIPPLINFYGRRFAVAQLIKWGYASLVSSGAPIAPGVDVAPLVQPPPPGGAVVGAGAVPSYNSNTARFNGAMKTDFRNFKPRYSQTLDEGGDSYSGRPSKSNNRVDSSYGGTRNQQLYPQGGPPNAGGYRN